LRISPRALTAMRTLSSSSWIDRWERSILVAPAADIRPEKGRVSVFFKFINEGKGRGGEREEEEERRSGVVGRDGGRTGTLEVYAAMSVASFRHFHVYNPIQSQHIQYYIGDPSLLS